MPVRWRDDAGWEELAGYLRWLSSRAAEVLVVDGSSDALYERHARDAAGHWRHLRPDPALNFSMGKVNGVTTGVFSATHERVVIADDDVRYDEGSLVRIAECLDRAELVRPQNYFGPLPWHARLDTGRTLLNRVFTGDIRFPVGDFPGTLAIRRSAFEASGGYDGDVIFENLELMRTVAACGGRVATPLDLYVRRLPPSTSHYLSQRVRQAYDDFAIPARLFTWLSVLPVCIFTLSKRRHVALGGAAAAMAAVAELGRRRAGGRRIFPFSSSLLAPVWLAERAISSWVAVYRRLSLGGVPYGDGIVPGAASSLRSLRRRHRAGLIAAGSRAAESDQLVGPVAEGKVSRTPAAADGDRSPL
jgi:hypothetical protein